MSAKRYYWLKMPRNFFKRHDIRIVESLPNGHAVAYFYLKLLVESVDHDGELRFNAAVPYDAEMLATITNTAPETVKEALEVLERFELIEITTDGTIVLPQAKKLIDSAVDNDNARRQARYRERQKEENDGEEMPANPSNSLQALRKVTDSVTKSNADALRKITHPVTNSNESKSKSKSKSKIIERDKRENDEAGAIVSAPAVIPPSPDYILDYMIRYKLEKGLTVNEVFEAEKFFNYYESNGWRVGSNKMKDWQAAARGWLLRSEKEVKTAPAGNSNPFGDLLGGNE